VDLKGTLHQNHAATFYCKKNNEYYDCFFKSNNCTLRFIQCFYIMLAKGPGVARGKKNIFKKFGKKILNFC